MKKWFLILVFFYVVMFGSHIVSAEVQSLGVFKLNTCIVLKQTCSNCSFINFSLSMPPYQNTVIINVSMNRSSPNLWTALFCNTTENGEYVYDTYGDLNGAVTTSSVDFTVNPLGKTLTNGQAVLYFMVFFISFIIFCICLIFGIYAPSGNKRDAMTGYIIAVDNIKYVKMFMIAISYLVFMLLLYFGFVISYGYLDLEFVGNLFNFAFLTSVVLIAPVFIVMMYVLISNKVRDSKLGDMLSRGLRTRG